MQLVIEISDGLYNNLDTIKNGSIASKIILDCVRKGKVLPKGHGRLIDADRLIKAERMWYRLKNGDVACPKIDIENAPTIIEADKTESEG